MQNARRPLSRPTTVRVDLRGLHQGSSRTLYPESQRRVTYTVEVVRKVRKKASSNKGETSTKGGDSTLPL
jgi:hypothetical protein